MSLRRLLYSIMFGAMPGALANYLPSASWLPLFRAIMFPGSWVFWLDGYVSQAKSGHHLFGREPFFGQPSHTGCSRRSPGSARQAIHQFLRPKHPHIGTLRKFAAAAGIPIEELVAGKQKGKK